jgi:hypothetical protein
MHRINPQQIAARASGAVVSAVKVVGAQRVEASAAWVAA